MMQLFQHTLLPTGKKYPLEYKTAHDEFERIVLIGEDLTYSTEFYFRLASLLIDKMEE